MKIIGKLKILKNKIIMKEEDIIQAASEYVGHAEEIEEDLLGSVEEIVEERFHFLIKDHRLTFHGICQKCQSKKEA